MEVGRKRMICGPRPDYNTLHGASEAACGTWPLARKHGPRPVYEYNARPLARANERAYGTGSLSLVQRLRGPML